MTAISPQDWQDQEDGRALRELREALPPVDGVPPYIHLLFSEEHGVICHVPTVPVHMGAPTIAAAADKARAALRERVA